jgi:hypothetical protein
MDVEITPEIKSDIYLEQDPAPIHSLASPDQVLAELTRAVEAANQSGYSSMLFIRIPSTAGDALVRADCIAAITNYVAPPPEDE